jgi:glycosyltransferase domain-containing protein
MVSAERRCAALRKPPRTNGAAMRVGRVAANCQSAAPGARQVMRDLTLIVPTYNRPQLLAALLEYLETEKLDCRVLVLDSSSPDVQAANRNRMLTGCGLDAEFLEFPDLDPTEKWRQGLQRVSTPFCAFCADDDLVIVEGVRQCLDVLRTSPTTSVVQGHSFTFLPRPEGDIELNNIVYFRPTIDDRTPLRRLCKLFEQYQAPSYGLFRTPALRRIFDALSPAMKVLTRELLWSALAAIDGHLVRLPDFSYGRCMGPSADYDCWHPLEWFCKNPEGLLAEYLRYRDVLTAAMMRRVDNDQQPEEIPKMLDLLHLRYLARHAPDRVLARQQIAGVDFAEYWPRHEIHLPLYDAAGVTSSAEAETLGPLTMRNRERSYILHPSFYAPRGSVSPQLSSIARLIAALDNYHPAIDEDAVSKGKTLQG